MEYDDTDKDIVGSITYTYAGRTVGKADIKTTGVVIDGYAFDNESTEETEKEESVSTVQIQPIFIILVAAAVILLIVLLFLLKKVYDNYYIIRHNREVSKDRRERGRQRRNQRRRKRRR